MSALYRDVSCQWIAIGKLWGFSGLVQNMNADHYGGYTNDESWLAGYITCAISPLEVLRCRAILRAIAERGLCRNARLTGAMLRSARASSSSRPLQPEGHLSSDDPGTVTPPPLRCSHHAAGLTARRAHLRAAGLEVHGVGLALWFNPASGCLHNACTLHNRVLPCLTFGTRLGEVEQASCTHGMPTPKVQ